MGGDAVVRRELVGVVAPGIRCAPSTPPAGLPIHDRPARDGVDLPPEKIAEIVACIYFSSVSQACMESCMRLCMRREWRPPRQGVACGEAKTDCELSLSALILPGEIVFARGLTCVLLDADSGKAHPSPLNCVVPLVVIVCRFVRKS